MDWAHRAEEWRFAYGKPRLSGIIKTHPEDFQVNEVLPFTPAGEGEHVWLRLRKTRVNSEALARDLATLAGVPRRDVSYSGRKDYHAVTEQWFSVWLPGRMSAAPVWETLNSDRVQVLEHHRHNKKLRTGTHRANEFKITLRADAIDVDLVADRVEQVIQRGVPNYFGEQRFGRGFSNMQQAADWLSGVRKVKSRNQRSMLLSSARAWLFNVCLSARVKDDTWCSVPLAEPLILNGTESFFIADPEQLSAAELVDLEARLNSGDIHPSAPLVGLLDESDSQKFDTLHHLEMALCQEYGDLVTGLQQAGVSYARRATRCMPEEFKLRSTGAELELSFALGKGQFATSVLRELCQYQTAEHG